MNNLNIINQLITILINNMTIDKIEVINGDRQLKGDFIQDTLLKIRTKNTVSKYDLHYLITDVDLNEYANITSYNNNNEITFKIMRPVNHNINIIKSNNPITVMY